MKAQPDTLLPVTVIMPIRDEAAFITNSLSAVLSQDYPSHLLEVLVVDGMSTDGTRDVVQNFINERHAQESTSKQISPISQRVATIRLLDNPRLFVPSALNVGIRQAEGDVIIIVGGHAMIENDYVSKCVKLLLETGTDCVGGALDSVGKGYVGNAIATAMSSPFGVGGSGFRVASADAEPRLTDSVPFPAYRRDVFKRVGLYNEVMVRHQDYEFNYRLRKAGGKILLLPSIRVKYHVRSSFRSLWRQYWQYGIWKGSFLRAHPASLKWRHLIPPVFVMMVALSALSALIPQVAIWTSGVAPMAYLSFVVFGLIMVGREGKARYIPILPLVFACLHFSYGFGIWLGLVSPKNLPQPHLVSLEREDALKQPTS